MVGPLSLPRRDTERGVALILVLVILPLVAILMTQLSFETTIGERLSSNALANQQFRAAIRARIDQMRVRLVRDLRNDDGSAQDGGAYDHAEDTWGPETDGGGTAETVEKGDDEHGDRVTLYTEVIDEQGKFNLNLLLHRDAQRAARALTWFRNILDFYRDPRFSDLESTEYDLNAAEAQEIAAAVLKFLKGEERNELVRKPEIPDPTPEMRQGVLSVHDLVFAHRLFLEKKLLERPKDNGTDETMPSLDDMLTIYGDGRLNANTAPIQVLRALFKEAEGQERIAEDIFHKRGGYLTTEEDQDQRDEALEQRREDEENEIEREDEVAAAFKSTNDIQQVERMGDSGFIRLNEIDIGRDFTVRSNVFTVIVTARAGNFLRQQRVVMERHTKGTRTLASEVRAVGITDLPETIGDDAENTEDDS